MTGSDDGRQGWQSPPPPGGQAPQYNQPYPQQPYPQQPQYPQGYPQPQYPQQPAQYPQQPPYPQQPQPYYPPQGQPPVPQPGYPPQQQQQPQQAYGQPQGYGQPVVIPIVGSGIAKFAPRRGRQFVISQEGIAHEDRTGTVRISWSELQRLSITTAYHQNKTKLFAPKMWRVRVILDPADQSFGQRHPELASIQGKYGAGPSSYGLPLGPMNKLVGPLAQAFATYGGQVFGGVVEEGWVMGFGYL
jgi:hypothetical protein